MIEAKKAVQIALQYVREFYPLYGGLELEEIDMTEDEKYWLITVGMQDTDVLTGSSLMLKPRKYKVVQIDAETANVRKMFIRKL